MAPTHSSVKLPSSAVTTDSRRPPNFTTAPARPFPPEVTRPWTRWVATSRSNPGGVGSPGGPAPWQAARRTATTRSLRHIDPVELPGRLVDDVHLPLRRDGDARQR